MTSGKYYLIPPDGDDGPKYAPCPNALHVGFNVTDQKQIVTTKARDAATGEFKIEGAAWLISDILLQAVKSPSEHPTDFKLGHVFHMPDPDPTPQAPGDAYVRVNLHLGQSSNVAVWRENGVIHVEPQG